MRNTLETLYFVRVLAKIVKTIENKTQSEFDKTVMQQTACQGLRTGKLGKYVLT